MNKKKIDSSSVIATSNKLTIKPGALANNSAQWYTFFIQTTYTALNYSQMLTVVISEMSAQVPLTTLA